MLRERGREERVRVVEGNSENLGWSRRVGGGWFEECLTKKVGGGSGTFFWTDPWLGGVLLCERFVRLFDLAENKSSTVAEMFHSGWEGGGEA
jgi:hypothetical protein